MPFRLRFRDHEAIEFDAANARAAVAHEIVLDAPPGSQLELANGTIICVRELLYFGGEWTNAWRPLVDWPEDETFGVIRLPSAEDAIDPDDDEPSLGDVIHVPEPH